MKHAFLAGLIGLTFLAAPQVGTAFSSAVKNPARPLLEQPAPLKRVPERIIRHTGYLLSFNSETLCPNWSAWELTAAETEGNERRYTDFLPDPQLPVSQQVTTYDYKGSGYDRGHMCPSADMKWSPAAQRDCFYMSNICPQDRRLNSGAWSKLENACRCWAKSEGNIYIVCGLPNSASNSPLAATCVCECPTVFSKSCSPHEKATRRPSASTILTATATKP